MGIGPGLGWGLLAIVMLTLLIAYVVLQETRAHYHWRGLVAQGDVTAIRSLLSGALDSWRTGRPPRGVPANIWSAVQTAQLVDTGGDYARLSTGVEGQYAMVDGLRKEVSSSFDEAVKVAQTLGDMLLYNVPDLQIPRIQIDIYSTFRDADQRPEQQCVLSSIIDRSTAAAFDWDAAAAESFVETFECRYEVNESGVALPVQPLDVARTEAKT